MLQLVIQMRKKARKRGWSVLCDKRKESTTAARALQSCDDLLLESAMSTTAPYSSNSRMMSMLPLNAA